MRNDFRNDASYEERVEQFRQEQKAPSWRPSRDDLPCTRWRRSGPRGRQIRGGVARVNRWRNS